MNQKVKVGIIGFGRMGGFYLEEMRKSDQWEVLYICDTDPEARDLARRKSPTSRIVADDSRTRKYKWSVYLHWRIPG